MVRRKESLLLPGIETPSYRRNLDIFTGTEIEGLFFLYSIRKIDYGTSMSI
jgi:hypothetical protein